MITLDQFNSLAVGDVIEAAPLFPPLSAEPITLRTATKSPDGDVREFVVTYFGIALGRWSCRLIEGVLTWQF